MYVCVCKAVTDSQIITAIEQGVCTRKQLIHCFGVGKDCGKCNKEVTALLAQKTLGQEVGVSMEKAQPEGQYANILPLLAAHSTAKRAIN